MSFVGPSYALANRKASIQRSVNMRLVGLEAQGKAPFMLESMPGLAVFSTLSGVVRGGIQAAGRAFFAAGSTLYEVLADGSNASRGTLATASGPVEMAYGLTQLVIVDGANGYVLNLSSNLFSNITSAAFYGSTRVEFLDNYFLFIRPDTQQFYITAINDATNLDALDFASAESSPDNLVSLVVDHAEAWMMGSNTTEIFFNSGNADFPFERNRGAILEVGCISPYSARKIDNSVFWIGQDTNGSGIVYRANGYQPQRISTRAIEETLQASSDLSAAVAFCWQENGLTYYAINAPGLTQTLVYEVAAGQWFDWCDIDGVGQFEACRAVNHVFAFGKHLIGGSDGVVYRMGVDVHKNGSDPLVRERTSPHDAKPGRGRVPYQSFWLDCTTGDASSDMPIEMSYTNDSGDNWSDPKVRNIGAAGNRVARVLWNSRLGLSRDRVWRVRFSGDAPFSIIDGGAA